MVRRHGLVALLVAVSLVTFAGCGKPKAGGKCTAGQAACTDPKSGLFCGSDGTFQAMTCHGSGGCAQNGAKVTCDDSIASLGDGCGSPGAACSSDMKQALLCQSGKFVLAETCKGPNACKVGNGDIMCDNDVADLNDPCKDEGDYACTSDKSNALKCTSGKMNLINTCRGPKGCSVVHPKPKETDIDCDMSIAQENDPCAIPGNEACTLDKKTMLTCKGTKYTTPVACSGPNACSVTANAKSFKVTCDQSGGGANGGGGGGGGGGGKKGKKK